MYISFQNKKTHRESKQRSGYQEAGGGVVDKGNEC